MNGIVEAQTTFNISDKGRALKTEKKIVPFMEGSKLLSNVIHIDAESLKRRPERFLNRELSWLSFNKRVLEESKNPSHPLLERVRFLSIASSNLEEFFMVRVAGLMASVNGGLSQRSYDGLSPKQQLEAIHDQVNFMAVELQETWTTLVSEMKKENIEILNVNDLTQEDKFWLAARFKTEIFPILAPIAVDISYPFPFIPNKGMAIAVQLQDKKTKELLEVLIPIPSQIQRFFRLPGEKIRYIALEDVILANIKKLYNDPYTVKDFALFRVLRDSELEIDDDNADMIEKFQTALKRRRRGNAIRLIVYEGISEHLKDLLLQQLKIKDDAVTLVSGFIGLVDVQEIITDENREHLFQPFDSRFPERILEFSGNCFDAIQQKDIVVHHPFESFDVVVQFLRQAARDPNVVAIKQTLYRTSRDSPIVEALIEAAEAGKSVVAMVELKARFDEEANMKWGRNMERAGVQVVYGFTELKTHAKMSLITRRENDKLRSYVHLGTGNYHPHTAKVYTDLSFFTCDPDLCADAVQAFNFMTGYAAPQNMRNLDIAPIGMRQKLTALIDREIAFAKAGKPAQIWAKCNSLLDPGIIDKFYEASQAGVDIDLVVRGICTLRPGVKGLSDNIRVKSIVGRFLEHSRIYCFGNGAVMPSRRAKVFISSADLMPRNLDYRIEALVPIENKTVHKQILDQIMVANLKDRRQSWNMLPDGSYERVDANDDDFCAHSYFMHNPSLSGRGKALEAAPMPPRLSLKKKNKK